MIPRSISRFRNTTAPDPAPNDHYHGCHAQLDPIYHPAAPSPVICEEGNLGQLVITFSCLIDQDPSRQYPDRPVHWGISFLSLRRNGSYLHLFPCLQGRLHEPHRFPALGLDYRVFLFSHRNTNGKLNSHNLTIVPSYSFHNLQA